jgi:hypothetical protein
VLAISKEILTTPKLSDWVANGIYELGVNINSSGTTFSIDVNNVTLDCAGYNLNHSSATAGYGINVSGYNFTFKNCAIAQTNLSLNGTWDFYSEGNSQITATNISLKSANLSFTGRDVALRAVTAPPADSAGIYNISRYINMTNNSAGSWAFVNISYNYSDLGAVTESTLKLYRYNGSSWLSVPGSGVNTAANYVYGNITNFSIFAPMWEEIVLGVSCVVNESCSPDYSDIFHMSNLTNAHSEFANQSDYSYKVCCKENLGNSLDNNCSGSNKFTILHLSNYTNAHAEISTETDYLYDVCLNSNYTLSNLTCSYLSSCDNNGTCVASISGTTNAHVADCTTDPYSTKICCQFGPTVNTPPTISTPILAPIPAYSNTDINCSVDVDDAEQTNLTVTFVWYKNDANIVNSTQTGSNTASIVDILNHSNFTRGDSIKCSARVYDGELYSNWKNSSALAISSSPTVIEFVSSISAQDPTEASYTTVDFSFVAYDADNSTDLNISSANADFSKIAETIRSNSCSKIADIDSYRINFSCSIDMWYWDGAGSWKVNARIKDINDNLAVNDTTNFTYNQLAAIITSPSTIYWSQILRGDTDKAALNFTTITNTGNAVISLGNVRVKAIDLHGETDSAHIISAANFTASAYTGGFPPAECSGDALQNGSFVSITASELSKGNGTGIEQIYYCLKNAASSLIKQAYSTTLAGPWYINVVASLAIIIPARNTRKKKKLKQIERELVEVIYGIKEKYSLSSEEIYELVESEQLKLKEEKKSQIPISVFSMKGIGPAEALVKYMKENLNMRFSEIAKILNRDDRTIWITYRNAQKKITSPIKIEIPERQFIPVSVLADRKLSILESVVNYLKSKNLESIEIAKMLGKDSRNIYTFYARAKKKLLFQR